MDQNFPLFVILGALFLFLAFFMLSSTAEDFLEPILSTIADKLSFSESLAGVTLVALANGAPDVFAAFAAAGDSAKEGITLSIGSLFGAGCFVTSVVLAGVLLSAKGGSIRIESSALMRDCSFYFLGAAWILIQGLIGEIGVIGVIGLFVNYFVFIGVVVHQELKYKKEEERKAEEENQERMRRPSFEISFAEDFSNNLDITKEYSGNDSPDESNDETEGQRVLLKGSTLNLSLLVRDEHIVSQKQGKMGTFDIAEQPSKTKAKRPVLKRQGTHSYTVRTRFQFHVLRHKMWKELNDLQEATPLGKVLSICKAPFDALRTLTIPSSTKEKWNKAILLVQPLTTSMFCLWQFGLLDNVFESKPGSILYILVVIICVVAVWRGTHTKRVPEGAFGFVLLLLGFATCIVWINFVANVFVDFIHLLSVLSGLPSNYLGLTVLAWGNSVNDLFVDSALAKKGLGQVAISGVFAGQFFNLSIGLGISLVRQIFSAPSFSVDFDLLAEDSTNVNLVSMILICCLLLYIFSTLLYGAISRYHLKKGYGVYLVSVYLALFITATLLIMVFKG